MIWLQRTNGHPYHPRPLYDSEGRPMLICAYGRCLLRALNPAARCRCDLVVDRTSTKPCECAKAKPKAVAG